MSLSFNQPLTVSRTIVLADAIEHSTESDALACVTSPAAFGRRIAVALHTTGAAAVRDVNRRWPRGIEASTVMPVELADAEEIQLLARIAPEYFGAAKSRDYLTTAATLLLATATAVLLAAALGIGLYSMGDHLFGLLKGWL